MQARMKNPVMVLPDALQALFALNKAIEGAGVPYVILKMVHLRASQINGCSVCVDMHARELKKAGESDDRIFAVSAWYDAPYFSDAERAALALTEAATRLSDRADPVPDAIWTDAAKHSMSELFRLCCWRSALSTSGIGSMSRSAKSPANGEADAGFVRDCRPKESAGGLATHWHFPM